MIYFADPSGRYSHSRDDITMQTYVEMGFIPSHVTDTVPLPDKDGFDVVLSGAGWQYVPVEITE